MVRRLLPALLLIFATLAACARDHQSSDVLARARQRFAAVFVSDSHAAAGSGLAISGGRVVTCYHVVHSMDVGPKGKPGAQLFVGIGGERRPARLVHSEPRFDLALLEVEGPPSLWAGEVTWAPREEIMEGQSAFLFGAPFGLAGSLLIGNVSHTNRTGTDPGFKDIPFIQVQGLAFPGTSGAAVFRSDGSIVGINRAAYGANTSGLGLVIPSGFVRVFLGEPPQK